jgi:hypothetical protein
VTAGCGLSKVNSARPSASAVSVPPAGVWRWRIWAAARSGAAGASTAIQFTCDAVTVVRSRAARGPTVTARDSASIFNT